MSQTAVATPPAESAPPVARVEVWPRHADAGPDDLLREADARFGSVHAVERATVYLIQAPLDDERVRRVAAELLADPIAQHAELGARPPADHAATIEAHYLPGVMDPVAQSTREAIAEMFDDLEPDQIEVRTAARYDLRLGPDTPRPADDALLDFARRFLANTVIQSIYLEPVHPRAFVRGRPHEFRLVHVPIRDLDDDGLTRLSRQGHLFLSLDEMRTIRDHYRALQRDPTDIELETLAQTWSEHCVHKTLKSTIHYRPADDADRRLDFTDRPGHTVHDDGSVTIENLLKSTVAAATRELCQRQPHRDWCVSVFEDNAGIVRFDDRDGVCIKVETHNHPSAIEPYGGAATGIGGCIRDILGTGLAARPVANTDVFCVAPPTLADDDVPRGVIHPRRILQQVVAGVRDYGNRMGIPTINGAVAFDDDYLGNPLVFAGCVGIIPLDKCFGEARVGDRIIALGGATGRDGIHGATFSSAELTDAHADEFAHAVQIGNPITQKKMLDVILRARDEADGPLFHAITDCGAGGFSSAVGEMGERVGACVRLDAAPLKYEGLTYTEVWISEAQERMVLAVPPDRVDRLRELCEAEDVPLADLGQFGYHADGPGTGEPVLVLTYHGREVGRLAMPFLHEGLPTPTRQAVDQPPPPPSPGVTPTAPRRRPAPPGLAEQLIALLRHPDIASKHWIIRQYDHEVQGGSTVKPLVGPEQDGPSDAAVIRPKLDSDRGAALGCGLAPHLAEKATARALARDGDSYWATLAALDEAIRNVVCVGAEPDRIALLDNFCWPGCDDPARLATLVRAAEACYDGAIAYRAPFVSGKDSLNNQFTLDDGRLITIPATLLITALGIVNDVRRCVTMDAKRPGDALFIVGSTSPCMGGSHHRALFDTPGLDGRIPRLSLDDGPRHARAAASLIEQGLVSAAHDCSDGGLLVAAAEVAFAGRVGLDLDLQHLPGDRALDTLAACFAETPGRYLLEIRPEHVDAAVRLLREAGVSFAQIGVFAEAPRLTLRTPRDGRLLDAPLDDLRDAWLSPLDW